jgi:hypothetical protein
MSAAKAQASGRAVIQCAQPPTRWTLAKPSRSTVQILFIVGLQWVGVAAKLGPSHVVFWLIAIALFYLPSAAVAEVSC